MHGKRLDYSGDIHAKKHAKRSLSATVEISWLAGFLTFCGWIVLFAFGQFFHFNEIVLATVICLAFALWLATNHVSGSIYLPLAVSLKMALIVGAFLGMYCFSLYGYQLRVYENSRSYHNAVPSEPALAVADGALIYFAEESHVDLEHSANFFAEDGHMYCAAPIKDLSGTRRVEFWAVGRDCCTQNGFFCDDAQIPTAKGGAVIFDTPSFFAESVIKHYDDVRKKAEAAHTLDSAKSPCYVRWVTTDKLEEVVPNLVSELYWFIGVSIVLYGIFSAGNVFGLVKAIHPASHHSGAYMG